MTSLAHQLKRLALPQTDPALLTRREVASLLFEPQDAATMDKTTFYNLGCTGLEELLGIEPAFLEFEGTLFSSASLTLERSVQSREVNQKLDANISLFLARLCPYFLLKPAHKCMEWLVHRYHIHRYNVDSLLACALPYHNTNVFVRVLQLLNISDDTGRWNWLHCLQKPGVPLSKGTLITHCYSDLSFLDFICTLVTRAIEAYSGHSESCSQLRIIFSFYASTIVPAIEAVDKVSDSFVSKLLPYVQKGLKSMLMDYKAASYMIVGQLAVKVVMEASLVDTLSVLISKSLLKEPVLAKEGVGCLIVLLQNQKDGAVGPRPSTHLCAMPALVSTLEVMALTHDVGPLLRYLLPHLIHAAFTCSSDEACELAVLTSVLQSLPLSSGLDQTVARLFLDEYVSLTELSDDNMTTLNQRLRPMIRLLESRYCAALDGVLGGHVTLRGAEQKRLFHQFLSLTMSSGKYQFTGDSDTSLLLSLKHPQPTIRVSAVEHLMSIISNEQHRSLTSTFLNDAVTDRLKDDVPEVVAAALKVVELLHDVLDPEHVVSCLLSVLHRAEPSAEQWLPVLTEAVRLLSDPRLGNGDSELVQSTGWRLLPFLVVTSASQSSLSTLVARCRLVTQHPLTLNWAEELDETMKRSSEADFVGLANQCLVSTLAKNLANMDHFTRRDSLEKLALVAEQQQGADARARVCFLVLTQTLLLSLGELTETQHLLTAQRVYLLMERPLLELIRNSSNQEAEPSVGVPLSFSAALTAYLSRGDGKDGHFGFTLLSLLGDFISALKCHDTTFKGEVWWNPEKLDSNTCCYLSLTCRLFGVVISGGMEGPAAGRFRALMKLLIKVHLPEPLMLFRFLCVLWGSSSRDNQLDVHIDAVLQTQALSVGGALLAQQPVVVLEELAGVNSPVFPSLLCCLSSPVPEVRRASFAALQSLSGARASPFQPIMEKLLKTADELLADPAYLSQALGSFHENSLSSKAKKQASALQQLLHSTQVLCCPSYSTAALLRVMSQVNGQSILSALLPLLERLLEQSGPDTPNLLRSEAQLALLLLGKYNEASAPLLAQDRNCLDLFIRALGSSTQWHPDIPSCQIQALEQITKSFFSAVEDESVQQKLLSVMFDLLVENPSPLLAVTISSVFKRIAVDGQLLANELAPTEKASVSMTVQQSRRSRMSLRNPKKSVEVCPEGGAVPWQRVSLILELLQHKKKVRRAQMLVPALFSLLSRSLEPPSADHTNMEYTKQLLLSCLHNICTKLSPDGRPLAADVLDEDKFMVELVVQCIRASDVPQTHHHALLLLGTTATIFPEKVLLNIMPIFTFMGTNIMRLDDAYSFRVITKTVQMVIPALIQARRLSGDSSAHVDAVVTRVVHVFADALPHVPEHRRLPVLVQLVTTLGPARFLWVLMLLLFKLHATRTAGAASEKDAALEKDVDFWISLCSQFEVGEQLASLNHILGFLLQLPDDKDEAAPKRGGWRATQKKKVEQEETMEELIFSVEAHSSKDLRHFKFISVSFLAQLLGSHSFIGKVAGGDDAIDESVQQLQQKLLEDVLRYIHSVARCVEENSNKPTAKFWRVLLNKAYDVLDKVNSLLPTDTFIVVVRGLMGNDLPSVRRKAMELLNNKLVHRTQWDPEQVAALMQLTGDLLRVVGQSPGEEEEAEQAINRQTALYSLKLLCRSFGSAHQEALPPVLPRSIDIITSPEEEKNVTGSALLCVAEVVSTLKALAIPHLPRLMPAVLDILKGRTDLLTNEVYLLSAVTALQHVVETLLHFISPYLQETTAQVCRLTQLVEASSSSSAAARLSPRLSSIRTALATKLPPRVLLPTVARCYDHVVADGKGQLGPLMSILKEHICQMEKEQLSFHQSELTSFFLTALDFRSRHSGDDLETMAETEGYVIDCLVAMVMKLSEVTFRSLFFKLCDWRNSGSSERLLTFCRLTDHIAGRLKGLFVLFAGNLVKPFADLLRQTGGSGTADVLFESGGDQKAALLLQYVLDSLHKIFLYDTQRFLSKERADALMGPLLDQLENTSGGTQAYQQRVTQHLIPCLGQFAVALADDTQWKTLNYQILLKSRHGDAKVRFSSLLMLTELTAKLKENYMVLLPETIPFLAELMEDECEEVEQQVQKVVQEMENILGEPLQSYF